MVEYHEQIVRTLSLTLGNKNDHCKNFSFTIQKSDTDTCQWHLAPTYDLTLCTEGYNGKYATSVNGTGHPTIQDMITIGTKSKMSKPHCMRIFEEVRAGCGDLLRTKTGSNFDDRKVLFHLYYPCFQHRIHYHRTAIRLLRSEISIHYAVHLTETEMERDGPLLR
ncbi:HipA domain-containing protein [Parabacteroides distasonis]|uniref:HipA domain-containing protein n=1 Tax=Parabacteroides distasonis TaxID=823 RepID=UPI002FEE344B